MRKGIGKDLVSFLGGVAERKEKLQQAVCYQAGNKTGKLELRIR